MPYYKTTIVVEVLSNRTINPDSLADIHDRITFGDCSGKWQIQSVKPLSASEVQAELVKQGSDPDFFDQ